MPIWGHPRRWSERIVLDWNYEQHGCCLVGSQVCYKGIFSCSLPNYQHLYSSLSSLSTRGACSVVVFTFPVRRPRLGDLQEIPKGCVAN